MSTQPGQPRVSEPRNGSWKPRRGNSDLDLTEFPPLTWSRTGIRQSLDELYAWAERLAVEAIGWYVTEKRRKSHWSRTLRALALALTITGAIVPVVALSAGRPAAGNWGFLLLALAAGCAVYDRFFGFTSSWHRYTATAASLRSQLIEYQAEWAREMVILSSREPDRNDAVRMIDFVRAFAWNVNDTIRTETEAWLTEFDTRMTEFESRLHRTEGAVARRDAAAAVMLPGPHRHSEDGPEAVPARPRGGNRVGEH
nr:DUF4231 domain-containing protein [Planosporangium flavigriseum]